MNFGLCPISSAAKYSSRNSKEGGDEETDHSSALQGRRTQTLLIFRHLIYHCATAVVAQFFSEILTTPTTTTLTIPTSTLTTTKTATALAPTPTTITPTARLAKTTATTTTTTSNQTDERLFTEA